MKKSQKIDMHIHTNASDGYHSPLEILTILREAGIQTFAVTDHDSIASLDELKRRAGIYNMRLIPGVELSADFNGIDLHFLGYFINYHNKRFLDYLYLYRRRRYQRAQEMIELFAKQGIKISINRIVELARNGPIGRPHFADVLIKSGIVSDRDEAFDKYLNEKSPFYVKKYMVTAEEVIALIHSIGGAAILAHPGISCAKETIVELIGLGLDGVEIVHPKHSPVAVKHFTEVAEKHGLLMTGGSDFHGKPGGSDAISENLVDISLADKLESYCDMKRSDWIISDEEISEDETLEIDIIEDKIEEDKVDDTEDEDI